MRFALSQEERLFTETIRRFLRNDHPISRARAIAENREPLDRSWWRAAAELGWTSLLVPERYGGSGSSGDELGFLALVAEEAGRALAPGPLISTHVVAETLSRSGSEDQRMHLLPGIASGELVASWCLSEHGRAEGVKSFRTRAERRGDSYVLRGEKVPVEAVPEADFFLVSSETEDGIVQFILPTDQPGLRVERVEGLDLLRSFGRVSLDNVRVPASAVVGMPGSGADDLERQLRLAIALECAECCGAAARVFELTLEWAFDRYSFGRPLASYQALKHRFADMKFWLEACFATTDGAFEAIRQGDPAAGRLARIAKCYVARHAPAIVQDCVQMHGGIGVTWEHDLHLYLRRVAAHSVWLGGAAEHRDAIAAELNLPSGDESAC